MGSVGSEDLSTCDLYEYTNARPLLIGERFNVDKEHRFTNWPMFATMHPYAYLTRMGAFLWSSGRKRLIASGVRWHAGANLLWPAAPGWRSKRMLSGKLRRLRWLTM
jgi:hypothetical protein